MEDGTGQSIFVNRRAVKRLAEPRWRHSLRIGERVSFTKTAGVKGFCAAGVMRVKETAPVEVWEEDEQSVGQGISAQGTLEESAATLSAPLVGGSVYATFEATVTVTHRAQTPAPTQHYVCAVTRSLDWVPLWPENRVWGAGVANTPAQQLVSHPPAVPVTVNPYIHRGSGYSPVRGPAVRRGPNTSSTRLGTTVSIYQFECCQ